jgi:hypothetical protein
MGFSSKRLPCIGNDDGIVDVNDLLMEINGLA